MDPFAQYFGNPSKGPIQPQMTGVPPALAKPGKQGSLRLFRSTCWPTLDGPGFQLTPPEASFYSDLFRIADVDKNGIVKPQYVMSLFARSKLPQETLSEVLLDF